jgi:hypothetical protein
MNLFPENKGVLYLLTLLYKIALDLAYISLYQSHSYYGIILDINTYKIIESYFFIFVIFLLIGRIKYKPSVVIICAYILFNFIPISTYYSLANESRDFFYMNVMVLFILLFVNKIPAVKLKKIYLNISLNIVSVVLFGILVLFLVIYNGYPSLAAFDLTKVYEVRGSFNSASIIERLQSVCTYIIVPILAVKLVKNKAFFHLFLLTMVVLFVYLSSGGKAIMAVFMLSIFSAIFLIRNNLISGIISLLFFLCISILIFENPFEHYLVFRPLITPAWISFVYYDFFSTHDFLVFSENFSSLLTSPYSKTSAEVVGDYLFSDKGGSWASSGFIGSAYSNLGFIGIIIDTVILSVVLMIFNALYSVTKYKQELLIMSFIFGILSVHIGLYTLLWSRGFILGMIIFWTIGGNGKIKKNRIKLNE